MKIEIEASDFEQIRAEAADLRARNKELLDALIALDEHKLREDAVLLAQRMFDDACAAVFEKLGFEQNQSVYSVSFENLEYSLGERWKKRERLSVTLGAEITTEFRKAFIKLGIVPEPE